MRRYRRPDMRPRKVEVVNPEVYQTSNERVRELERAIELGEKASTIIDFVESFIDDEEENILKKLADCSASVNAEELRRDYLAALRFQSKVKTVIREGERKTQALSDLFELRRNRRL